MAVKVKENVRLKNLYHTKLKKELQKELQLPSIMRVPSFEKIVISTSFGDLLGKPQQIDEVINNLFLITGQKPIKTVVKNAIANFHIRKGMVIGAKVTLRRTIMYEFLDKLINIIIPRVKDFQGFSVKNFDKWGNYSFGIKEHLIFPEINIDKVSYMHGMGITFTINSWKAEHSISLLKKLNFPLSGLSG